MDNGKKNLQVKNFCGIQVHFLVKNCGIQERKSQVDYSTCLLYTWVPSASFRAKEPNETAAMAAVAITWCLEHRLTSSSCRLQIENPNKFFLKPDVIDVSGGVSYVLNNT